MKATIQYTCSSCGRTHTQWPALTFNSPDHYHQLSQEEKEEMTEFNEDLCIIRNPEQTDWFIRCTMTQKVTDHCEDLEYGLWVSLSEKSFADYSENLHNKNHETQYFGWLCNDIPEYAFNDNIPTTVCTRTGNLRPEIIPHQSFKHPFVYDYYNGITKREAERRIQMMLKVKEEVKRWWKFW